MAEIQEETETIEFTPTDLNLDPLQSLQSGFGVIGKASTSQSELAYYSQLYMSGQRMKSGWNQENGSLGSMINREPAVHSKYRNRE